MIANNLTWILFIIAVTSTTCCALLLWFLLAQRNRIEISKATAKIPPNPGEICSLQIHHKISAAGYTQEEIDLVSKAWQLETAEKALYRLLNDVRQGQQERIEATKKNESKNTKGNIW